MQGTSLGLGLHRGGGLRLPFQVTITGLFTDSLGAYGQIGNHAGIGFTSTCVPEVPSTAPFSTLHAQDWVTANEMHLDGIYWMRPYDLEAMGTPGQTLAAANKRYVWLASSDHHGTSTGFRHGAGIWRGYSSDPGVLPTDWVRVISDTVTTGQITGVHNQMETPWLVYNPDDAAFPFYVYAHGNTPSDGSRDQETLLFRSANLSVFQTPVISHSSIQAGVTGHTGYQTVYRIGPGQWESYGLSEGGSVANFARWTSTNGQTFTRENILNRTQAGRTFSTYQGAPPTVIDGQLFSAAREEYTAGVFVPIEADGDLSATAATDTITVGQVFDGVSPGPGFVQGVSGYEEDGIYHFYLRRGYFLQLTAPSKNDWTDYHTALVDRTAAASAAPVGVRASSASGTVTVSWYDALPHRNYRVARSSSASGPWTDLADVNGLTYTDSAPTANAVNFYRVTTLNGGPQKSRIVDVFASAAPAIVNRHILRATNAGAVNMDPAWLTTVTDWLASEGLTQNVVVWTSPAFGVTLSGSSVQRIMDLGATIHPFKYRDALALTSDSRYLATGVSGAIPGIGPNGNAAAFVALSHGALNLFRQKSGLTVAAAYNPDWTFDTCPIVYRGGFGMELRHNPSSDRIAFSLRMTGGATTQTAIAPAPDTGDIFAAGVIRNGDSFAYCNGTAGTPVTISDVGPLITGFLGEGDSSDVVHPLMGSDSNSWRPSTQAYTASPSPASSRARLIWSDLMMFDIDFSMAQLNSLNTLMQARLAT